MILLESRKGLDHEIGLNILRKNISVEMEIHSD